MRPFIVLIALSLPVAAHGAERLPSPDPPGVWRQLGQTDAETTSRCIGLTKDPICVVETHLACLTRHNPQFCAAVGTPRTFSDLSVEMMSSRYRIESVRRVPMGERFMEYTGRFLYEASASDVQIDITQIDCLYKINCSPPEYGQRTYFLRQHGKKWQIEESGILSFPGN